MNQCFSEELSKLESQMHPRPHCWLSLHTLGGSLRGAGLGRNEVLSTDRLVPLYLSFGSDHQVLYPLPDIRASASLCG